VGQPERGRIEMFTGGQSAAVAAEGGCVGDRTRVSAAVTRRATVRVASLTEPPDRAGRSVADVEDV
jgi:hypothetical protein